MYFEYIKFQTARAKQEKFISITKLTWADKF
jgi:hypothetical protein